MRHGNRNRMVWAGCLAVMLWGVPPLAAQGVTLVINEVMASNGKTKADLQGQFDDWIEIHNYGAAAVDMAGLYVTDDPDSLTKWQIPAGRPDLTTIAPHGYLLIWADQDTADAGLHAGFKLSAGGESIALVDTDGVTVIDSMTFPALSCDVSYGRGPDAGDEWRLCGAPTPGAPNGEGYDGLVANIEFSHAHGFYREPFSVTLSCATADAIIFYTLDGEVPGPTAGTAFTGAIYTGSVPIDKTTCLRAVAVRPGWKPSAVRAQTYIFVSDVVRQSPTGAKPGPGWPEPSVTPVTAYYNPFGPQELNYGMDPDVVNDPRYKEQMEDALLSLPSISLVTSLGNLFDPSTGIYVNALQDGVEWERPVSVELIYPDGTEGFQIDAGLRIRGGFGRVGDNAKHGFRVFFRPEYGAAELHYPLFGDEGVDTFEKFDLRAEQNYSWAFRGDQASDPGTRNTMLRDIFSRDLQGATGQPYTRSRYYFLYINGQLWGIYQTQERSEARFAASYFGGSPEDYDVAKVDAGVTSAYTIEVTDGTLDAYQRLWQAAAKGFATDSAYYRVQGLNPDGTRNPAYERLLDVDNLIDYMILTFYVGDIDGPISSFLQNRVPNNFYALYNRTNPDGFKFFRHDCEHTMLDLNTDRTASYPAGQQVQHFNPQWLHQQLAANPEYRMHFTDHVYKHFFNDGVMTPAAAARLLQARKDSIDPAVIVESARWGDTKVDQPKTKDDWLREVRYLFDQYLPKRTDLVLTQFKSRYWYSPIDAPTFNQHGGTAASGFALTTTAPFGDIWYTLDGSDPRLPRNLINTAHATKYTGPVVLTRSVQVRARAFYGMWSAVHDAVFAVGPVAESLRVSELMYHPADNGNPDDPNTEYLELTNIGTETIDLNLVRFSDGIDFTFPSTKLAPGGCCLVVKDIAAFEARYGSGLPVAGQYTGSLANDGETITLLDAAGRTIQSFSYDDEWYGRTDGDGYSLTLVNPGNPDLESWSRKSAWRASTRTGGSPGACDTANP
jgi:hypothetical protein